MTTSSAPKTTGSRFCDEELRGMNGGARVSDDELRGDAAITNPRVGDDQLGGQLASARLAIAALVGGDLARHFLD